MRKKREKLILEQIALEASPNFKGYKGVTIITYGGFGHKTITPDDIDNYKKEHGL